MNGTDLVDRAAENVFVKATSRLFMIITPPVFLFLAWQVWSDNREQDKRLGAVEIAIVKIEGALGQLAARDTQAEARLTEQSSTLAAIGISRSQFQDSIMKFQQEQVRELAAMGEQIKGLRTDINRLFDDRQRRSENERR